MNYTIGTITIGLILFVFAFGILITNPEADKKVSTARNAVDGAAQNANIQSRSTVDLLSKNVTSIVIEPMTEKKDELVKMVNSTLNELKTGKH